MQVTDRELFLKYAVPCGTVLVQRGKLRQEKLAAIRKALIEGRPVRDDLESIFTIGVRMCKLTAREMGKKAIDSEVIRRYFWKEHAECIKWRSEFHPDIRMEDCIVLPGRVLGVRRGEALVETPAGKKTIKTCFVKNIKKGDFLTVHYSHACEKIGKTEARELWEMHPERR